MNTHRAIVECAVPPSMHLIAGGSRDWCVERLKVWTDEHPTPQYSRAIVVEVTDEVVCEPGVGVYAVPVETTAAAVRADERTRIATEAPDIYELRELGVRVLGDEQCCELACNGGGCETCPCCCAGWCVTGADGLPDPTTDADNYAMWLDVAAEHNPTAKRLADVERDLLAEQESAVGPPVGAVLDPVEPGGQQ